VSEKKLIPLAVPDVGEEEIAEIRKVMLTVLLDPNILYCDAAMTWVSGSKPWRT